MTELLAPAGTLEKLKWALAYGADAVYFGMKDFSLRSYAENFTPEDAAEGLRLLHAQGKRGYATLNIYPFTDEYPALLQTAGALAEMGVDAFIASDLGVIQALAAHFPRVPIHVSTQANTVSAQAALAYRAFGATRVNLARELSLAQIREIQAHIAGQIESEVFIHGSVCFSYSGRCAISDYLKPTGTGYCAKLTDIAGIGAAKAEMIEKALEKFWETHPVAAEPQADPVDETPDGAEQAMTEEMEEPEEAPEE